MASEGLPVEVVARVVGVSVPGCCACLIRPPRRGAIPHALLTDVIRAVHTASNGICGAHRVHAQLTLGQGVPVGHVALKVLEQRAGLRGSPGARRPWSRHHRGASPGGHRAAIITP